MICHISFILKYTAFCFYPHFYPSPLLNPLSLRLLMYILIGNYSRYLFLSYLTSVWINIITPSLKFCLSLPGRLYLLIPLPMSLIVQPSPLNNYNPFLCLLTIVIPYDPIIGPILTPFPKIYSSL